MSPEELLNPRIKVIANDTSGNFEVGDILTPWNAKGWGEGYWVRNFHLKNSPHNIIRHPEKFPHLFRKPAWWEERKVEDLPEYVKDLYRGEIHLVEAWNYLVFWTCKTDNDREFMQDDILPATREEYEQYISS